MQCNITLATIILWGLLLGSTAGLLAKETFQVMHSQQAYFSNWENWVQLGIIVDVILIRYIISLQLVQTLKT